MKQPPDGGQQPPPVLELGRACTPPNAMPPRLKKETHKKGNSQKGNTPPNAMPPRLKKETAAGEPAQAAGLRTS